MEKILKAFQKVIRDWSVIEVFLTIVFFPWSLIFIAFWIIQEYKS